MVGGCRTSRPATYPYLPTTPYRRSDDDDDSPHFNLSPLRMMTELSRLAQDYGIEFWIWYPALDKSYGDPAQVEFALREWRDVLRRLPKVDALFVPGGDPGGTVAAR